MFGYHAQEREEKLLTALTEELTHIQERVLQFETKDYKKHSIYPLNIQVILQEGIGNDEIRRASRELLMLCNEANEQIKSDDQYMLIETGKAITEQASKIEDALKGVK
jgi:hypothetical protein